MEGDTDMASRGAESEGHSNSPLVTSIALKIARLHPMPSDICIYRAPPGVRELNEKAYTPRRVSIGPLHHGKEHLFPMEEQKLRYLREFLHRTGLRLDDCASFIREFEDRVRNCYAESFNFTSDEFVEMILVDSSFIIEVIWRYNFWMPGDGRDFLSNPSMLGDVVRRDMILLENQIPYFVLEGLFNLPFPHHSSGRHSFISLSIEYFGDLSLWTKIPDTTFCDSQVKHFVDLLRVCHLPSTRRLLPPNKVSYVAIPTARHLQEVGLSFKKGSSNNILDIHYDKGVLTIPRFEIDDSSEIVLRNLIAFETCHYLWDSYITDYVFFMNDLMDNAEDADILDQNEIFRNLLVDRASVATLFHNLTCYVLFLSSNYYYHDLCQEVNAYSKDPWHKWKAIMKHDYFSTPWRIVSVVAAVMLLVLTLIQTICSVISVLQKK